MNHKDFILRFLALSASTLSIAAVVLVVGLTLFLGINAIFSVQLPWNSWLIMIFWPFSLFLGVADIVLFFIIHNQALQLKQVANILLIVGVCLLAMGTFIFIKTIIVLSEAEKNVIRYQ